MKPTRFQRGLLILLVALPVFQLDLRAPGPTGLVRVRPDESRPPGFVSALARAIANVEGWKAAGSPTHQLHNPCALVFAGQPHAWPAIHSYAAWSDDAAGFHACESDLVAKLCAGRDLAEISRTWSARPAAWLSAVQRELAHFRKLNRMQGIAK